MVCVTAAGCCCRGNNTRRTHCNTDRVESQQLQESSKQDGGLKASLRQTATAVTAADDNVCVLCAVIASQLNVAV